MILLPFNAKSLLLPLYLSLCLLVWMQLPAQNQPVYQTAVVKGKMMDLNSPQFQMVDLTETGAFRRAVMNHQTGPDSSFRLQINLNGATYIRIGANELYVNPGDSINGLFYAQGAGRKSRFSGRGSAACEYLKTNPSLTSGSYLIQIPQDELMTYREDPKQLEARVLTLADARRKMLNETPDLDESFRSFENARIDADIINSLLAYPDFYVSRPSVQGSKAEKLLLYDQLFGQMLPLILPRIESINQGQFLNLENCREVLYKLNEKQDKTQKFQYPWQGYVRSWYLTRLILQSIGSASISQISSEVERLKGLNALAPNHVVILDAALEPFKNLLPGAPAMDFKVEDTHGKVYSLSAFKGQVIVIDFWATWCGPCRMEAPHFERIKEQFPDMKFLSISTDRDKDKWLNFVNQKPSQEGHFHVVGNDYGTYQVTSIPRFMVINKDFTLADSYAQRPSGNLAAYLKGLQ
ncbi:MAG: TlpA family protein disulfide reductase [Bacteroidia bacterium]|nr:TlpA family protein disulfide reductase [Bacteroidia bacterium]